MVYGELPNQDKLFFKHCPTSNYIPKDLKKVKDFTLMNLEHMFRMEEFLLGKIYQRHA